MSKKKTTHTIDILRNYEYPISETEKTCWTIFAKTSLGMFEDLEIDNDLDEIIKVIDAYNEGE